MAIYKTTQGRLINDKNEWVWNGESYDYVQSHPNWLPLVFKNTSDAEKFEDMEKVWKAQQIVKNSKNKQEVQIANAWLKNHNSSDTKVAKHSDMDDGSYTYMYGGGRK